MNGSTDNQSPTSPTSFYDQMRRENADNPHILANIDHLERVETRAEREMPATIPPCPSWCAVPAGHIYGYRDDPAEDEPITYLRHHFSDPDGDATLVQEERNREGVVDLDPVTVHLDFSTRDVGPADLRRYAAALLDLADKLEQVTA